MTYRNRTTSGNNATVISVGRLTNETAQNWRSIGRGREHLRVRKQRPIAPNVVRSPGRWHGLGVAVWSSRSHLQLNGRLEALVFV
jgi:hypothetical protein